MKLAPIFVDDDTKEGLYAIKYPNRKVHELKRLFDNWKNIEYVSGYENKSFIESEYFMTKQMGVDEVIGQISEEADILLSQVIQYVNEGFKSKSDNLQMLFKPLYNKQTALPVLQASKAKIRENKKIRNAILRVYGLRIDINTFVVTGGAIKLTRSMDDHEDTKEELRKIDEVKAFLKKNEIEYQEDILNFYTNEP